jgi:hypothetical protein
MSNHSITLTAAQEADVVLRVDEAGEATETITEYCQRMVDGPIAISAAQALQRRFDAVVDQDAMLTAEEQA